MRALTQSQRESCNVIPAPLSHQGFLFVIATLFVSSAALTTRWCSSMSAMDMPMPGGWAMSMMWMRMPGQTWLRSAADFVGMWTVMMVAMMMPSFAPKLLLYRESIRVRDYGVLSPPAAPCPTSFVVIRCGHDAPNLRTAFVALGYFSVWTAIGMAIFPLGTLFADAAMNSQSISNGVPLLGGIVIVTAGVLQFSPWKAHYLACCREVSISDDVVQPGAWRQGLRYGIHCVCSCSGLTAILLVFGVMDLRAMVVVTAAITAERLLPFGHRLARVFGAITVLAGLLSIAGGIAAVPK